MKRAYPPPCLPQTRYCTVCKISCPTDVHFEAHIRGKKHRQNVQGDDYVAEKRFDGCDAGINGVESAPTTSSVATVSSTSLSSGEKWIIKLTDGRYTCVICAVSFSESGYDLHVKGGKHFRRMRGGASSFFGDKFDLNIIKNMSAEYCVSVRNTVWCAICDVKIKSEGIYKTHIISRDHLKRLKEMKSGRRLCTTCNLRFVKKSGLRRHLHCVLHGIKHQESAAQPSYSPTIPDFVCNFCCKTFPNEERIRKHYRDSGHDKLSGVPSYLKSLREKRQKERKWERPATVSSADVFSGQRTDVEAISSATYDEEYYEELDDDDDDGANNDNDEPDSGNDNGYEENNEDEIQGDSNDQPSQSIVLMQSSESHCNVDEYDDEQDEYYDDDDVEEQEKCANSGPQPPFAPSASDQRRLAVAVGTSAVGPLRSSHSESVIAINNNDQADVDRYLAKNPLEFSGNAVSVNVAFSVPKMTQIYLGSGICVNIGTEFEELSTSSLIASINEACIRKDALHFNSYYKFLCAGCNVPIEADDMLEIHMKSFRHGDFIKASLGKIQERLWKHQAAVASTLPPTPTAVGAEQLMTPCGMISGDAMPLPNQVPRLFPGSMLLQTSRAHRVNIPSQATIYLAPAFSTSDVSSSVSVYQNLLYKDVRMAALSETQKQLIRQCPPIVHREAVERNAASYSTFNSRYLMPGVTAVPMGRLSVQEKMDVEANHVLHKAHLQLSAEVEFLEMARGAVERLELVLKSAYDKLERDQMTNSILNRTQMAGPFCVGPFASDFMMKCDQKEPIVLVMLCTKYPTELMFRDFYRRCCEEIEAAEDARFSFKTRKVALESSIYVTFLSKVADLHCRVMFTSEQAFNNIQTSDRPLPWAHCQYALTKMRRAVWIQAVVLISVMSLNSYYTPCLRVSDGIKRTLEVVASGALTGITDPCDGVTNALGDIGAGQAHENWMASAQQMVRLLGFNRVDALLGMSHQDMMSALQQNDGDAAAADGGNVSRTASGQQAAEGVGPLPLCLTRPKSAGANASREAKCEGDLEPTVCVQSKKLKACKTEIILLE